MSLHVIIGYPDSACKGQPFPVYCGPSLTAAQIAKDRHNSTAASFMEFRNAAGLRKNNPSFNPLAPAPVITAPAIPLPPVPDEIKSMKKDDLIKALGYALLQNEQLQDALTQAPLPPETPIEESATEEPAAEELPE